MYRKESTSMYCHCLRIRIYRHVPRCWLVDSGSCINHTTETRLRMCVVSFIYFRDWHKLVTDKHFAAVFKYKWHPWWMAMNAVNELYVFYSCLNCTERNTLKILKYNVKVATTFFLLVIKLWKTKSVLRLWSSVLWASYFDVSHIRNYAASCSRRKS
jgi:hypothetical protein